jgi:hypothetical protein
MVLRVALRLVVLPISWILCTAAACVVFYVQVLGDDQVDGLWKVVIWKELCWWRCVVASGVSIRCRVCQSVCLDCWFEEMCVCVVVVR